MNNLVATLTNKYGEQIDVTQRLDLGTVGNLTESIEDALGSYTHSDITLTLKDFDGVISEQFRDVQPTDTYQFVIERETGRRRPRYERMFAGVLDLPWSVRIRTKQRKVEVRVFSYSKLLERASAAVVARSFSALVGTSSATSTTVTGITDTTGMYQGDKIRLSDGVTDEERTIDTVDSSTQVTTTEAWTNTLTDATLTVTTPWYRYKSPEFLFAALFDAAGITDYEINLDGEVTTLPFASAISLDGLPVATQTVKGLTQQSGDIVASMSSSPRRNATAPNSGWTAGTATTNVLADWRNYYAQGAAEPASIMAVSSGSDDGQEVAWDHTNGYYYSLSRFGGTLKIQRNGVDVKTLDTGATNYILHSLDYWPGGGTGESESIIVSYTKRVSPATDTLKLVSYDIATDTITTVYTGRSGKVRTIYPLQRVAFYDASAGTIEFLQQSGLTWVVDRSVEVVAGSAFRTWSLRVLGEYLFGIYTYGTTARVRMYHWPDLEMVQDFQLAANYSGGMFCTLWTDDDGDDNGIAYAGGSMVVISTKFLGIIEYADFSDMSCGAALRELAQAVGCYVTVRHDRVGIVQPRATPDVDQQARILDEESDGDSFAPLEETLLPLWADYRAGVRVSWKDADGNDGDDVIAGDAGDSAKTLELSPDLPLTESLALALASALHGYVSVIRREAQQSFRVQGELVRPLDQVRLATLGGNWLVVSATTSHQRSTQELRLIELVS